MIHILNATGGSEEINEIKYEGQQREKEVEEMKKETPLITIDWIDLLPPPPENTSDSTKLDLQELERVTRNLSKEDFDLVMTVDKEPSDLFMPYLKRNGLTYPKELIDLVLENVYPIWLKLKYHYRRARPFQIAPHLGFTISVILAIESSAIFPKVFNRAFALSTDTPCISVNISTLTSSVFIFFGNSLCIINSLSMCFVVAAIICAAVL